MIIDKSSGLSVLKSNSIVARKYFYPLTNAFDCYRDMAIDGAEKTPVASYTAERVLTLPLYADLKLEQVEMICRMILE